MKYFDETIDEIFWGNYWSNILMKLLIKHFDETVDQTFSRNYWWNILGKLLMKHFDETIDQRFSRNCWWNILTKHFDETIDETFSQVEGSLNMHWIPQELLRTSPTIIPMHSTWMGLDRKPQHIHYQSDKNKHDWRCLWSRRTHRDRHLQRLQCHSWD